MKKANKILTSSIALVLVLAMCLGVFPTYNVHASNEAEVNGVLTLDKEEVVLDEEDKIEEDWVYEEYYRLYAENVNFTFTVEGKVDSIYSNAYLQFDYQLVYLGYDSASSTENTTVYKGFVIINQYTPGNKDYVFNEVSLVRKDSGEMETVQVPQKTLKVTRNFADNVSPQVVSISIDRQGETIKDGNIEISMKVSDNVGMDEGNDAVSLILVSPMSDVDKYYELDAQGDGTYKTVIDVESTGFCQSKWYVYWVTLYDTVRNQERVVYGEESPYYFYIGEENITPEEPKPEEPKPEEPKPEEPKPEEPKPEQPKPEEPTSNEQMLDREIQKLFLKIAAGKNIDSIIDKETQEKLIEAAQNQETITAELVVKEMRQDEISSTDRAAIENKVDSVLGTDVKVQYMDVLVMLKANDKEIGTLNQLSEEITITVAIPEELKAEGRTYKVIRNHNGEVAILDTVVNGDGTISFKTDRFSTYALGYANKEETNTNPVVKPTTPSTDTKAPQTGDDSSVKIYVVICLVALAAIVATKKKNRFAK